MANKMKIEELTGIVSTNYSAVLSTEKKEVKINKKEARITLDELAETIFNILDSGQAESVPFMGGQFVMTETKPRDGRNPATGEAIKIPAGRKISFKAGKGLKAKLK